MSKVLTPVNAIRAKCLDCSCNQTKEVTECPVKNCSLYPYRLGKRPRATLESETLSLFEDYSVYSQTSIGNMMGRSE